MVKFYLNKIMKIKTELNNKQFLSQISDKELKGKIVIVRGSLNVPLLENGKIENDFRLQAMLPTLDFLRKQKAKIVLIGHIGRELEDNLEPVFQYFKELKIQINFDKNTFHNFNTKKIKEKKEKVANLRNGEILLLDNLRQNSGEKSNHEVFRKFLRGLGDIYIQDAFSVSHRQHTSMTIEPDFYGCQYEKEIENLQKVLQPESPSIFILGGAKIKTKIPLIEKALEKYDQVIVGGLIANTFFKYLGRETGDSLVEEIDDDILKRILEKDNLIIPNKVIVEREGGILNLDLSEIKAKDKIVDIDPEFFIEMQNEFQKSKFIFLNGPVGYYEGGYIDGTKKILELSASPNNFFLVGGGNTASLVFKLKLEKNIDFISTGGGALINFLLKK